MPLHVLIALAATASTPGDTATAPASKPEAAATRSAPAVDPMQAMAAMEKLFDKMFPAGPEPEASRLGIARQATMTMFPKGAYAQGVTAFVDRTTDQVLNMSEADFAEMFPEAKDKKAKDGKVSKAKVPSREPLRLMLSKKDPEFNAKLTLIRGFVELMFVKFGDVAEPRFREGMARALARKFDARQLGEIQAFLATPTGAAYGREMVGLWFQPEVIRGSFQVMPDMMKLMPEMMKGAAALESKLKPEGKTDKKAD